MIRVALIGPVPYEWGGPPESGGVSTYVRGLATALTSQEVQVCLLGDNTWPSNPARPPAPIQFWPMLPLAQTAALPREMGMARTLQIAGRLARADPLGIPWRQRLRFLYRAVQYAAFLNAAQADVIHVMHAEFRQYLCQRIVKTPVPVVASVLSVTVLLRPPANWVFKMAVGNYGSAARLIACSHFVEDAIRPYVAAPDRIVYVPNGVDIEEFYPRSAAAARTRLGLPAEGFIVLYVGSLLESKGVRLLLESFARGLADQERARLVFVGSGPEALRLHEMAAAAGVAGQVTVAGYRPRPELPDWYAASDVYVLPSRSEGLSMALLEALASGRPVITTCSPDGSHDAVENGVQGFLIKPGDGEALTAALVALARSPEMGRQMGVAARRQAVQRFSWEVVAAELASVYRQVAVGAKDEIDAPPARS